MLTFGFTCLLACGAILCALLFSLASLPMLGILQQSGYSGKGFFKWYYRKRGILSRRYSLLTLSLFLLVALFDLCFSFAGAKIANLISVIPFLGICALYLFAEKRALKAPLRRTGRAVRLAVCYFILLALAVFGAEVGLVYAAEAIGYELAPVFRFVPVALFPLLFPVLLALANLLMKAYEIPRNNRFIRRATQKLAQSACVKVGITGSFGKTSVKTFACAILSEKYKALATPASYNTPIGIARTVNENALDCDIFLAEMGARRTGDIAELCKIVQPSYGVVTGVCSQHMQTFGSLEAIKAEKGVLARYAEHVVLGVSASDLTDKTALREGADFAAEEIECSPNGTKFTLRLGNRRVPVFTPLLGRHCAQDIALAAALCFSLGMSVEEIAAGIGKIEPVPHRLQKIEANGLHILDDSYNCNAEGAKNAVETLKLFGGRKVVVTPGIVELGEIEGEENEKLGASLAGLDLVVLVGETLVLPVRSGYLAAGGKEERLRVVPTLFKAQEILKTELSSGDSVLFLNDLPDIYS